ncbi:unnamed protein product [Penicillium olsonii]|uniref:Hydrophobin n=1 Tax=Penicillium olsonii TaxID=99116 RepID=A0A9W4HTG6_PENOL|nr:unnamed protein product [Penicillium olsonii]CAG8014248.1 unnamed protein product [Penicillium olsonii]CAG8149944.1 unnamed protein product [Penicillium olsonii]
MHPTTLFMGLTALFSVTSAIPVAHENPTPTPSMSKVLLSPSSSASASASPTPSINPFEAYTCPPKKQKGCCTGLQQASKDIISPLGNLVPIVGGLQISSAITFQCKKMGDKEPPSSCDEKGYAPMCCNDINPSGFSSCKGFEQTKKNFYTQHGQAQESQADMIMDIVT